MASVETPLIAYIAGRMAGRPNHGYDDFVRAAAAGRKAGYLILSPHEGAPTLEQIEQEEARHPDLDFRDTTMYHEMMRRDIQLVLMSSVVFVLPEWYMSQGATFEVELAKMVGIEVVDGAWLLD